MELLYGSDWQEDTPSPNCWSRTTLCKPRALNGSSRHHCQGFGGSLEHLSDSALSSDCEVKDSSSLTCTSEMIKAPVSQSEGLLSVLRSCSLFILLYLSKNDELVEAWNESVDEQQQVHVAAGRGGELTFSLIVIRRCSGGGVTSPKNVTTLSRWSSLLPLWV